MTLYVFHILPSHLKRTRAPLFDLQNDMASIMLKLQSMH